MKAAICATTAISGQQSSHDIHRLLPTFPGHTVIIGAGVAGACRHRAARPCGDSRHRAGTPRTLWRQDAQPALGCSPSRGGAHGAHDARGLRRAFRRVWRAVRRSAPRADFRALRHLCRPHPLRRARARVVFNGDPPRARPRLQLGRPRHADHAVPPEVSERAAARVRHARHLHLPDLGHLAHEEAPAQFAGFPRFRHRDLISQRPLPVPLTRRIAPA